MIRTTVAALSAVASVAFVATPATATHTTHDCHFSAETDGLTAQDVYTGYAWGTVSANVGEAVSVQCTIVVNGVTVDSTPVGSGVTSAWTSGPVAFVRHLTDQLELCIVVTASHNVGMCYPTTTIPWGTGYLSYR